VHLATATVATAGETSTGAVATTGETTTTTGRLAGGAATGATARLVAETFFSVKLLFTGSKHESLLAIRASEIFILI
jgi:hypothetical protein